MLAPWMVGVSSIAKEVGVEGDGEGEESEEGVRWSGMSGVIEED